MFVDASALVAIVAQEPGFETLQEKFDGAGSLITSPLSIYETALALARLGNGNVTHVAKLLGDFLQNSGCHVVSIDSDIGAEAIAAFARFGRGRHQARLNMGDCFSYACAKALGLPILCKGEDFTLTDIEIA